MERLKKFLKQGSGEILGFLWVSPCIIFILVLLVSVVQLGSIKERLEYTAYLACRQAVVASDTDKDKDYLDDAKKAAKKTAEEDLAKSGLKYEAGSVKVKLKIVGTDKSEKGGKWEKGNYVQCTVSVKVKAVTPFLSGRKSANIVMMIEKPASEGNSYPWLENL